MARINIKALTDEIALHTAFSNTPKSHVEDVIRSLFTAITDHIVADNEVAIPGFGKFSKFTSSTTGNKKLKYSQAKAVKDAVNA